MGIYNSAKEKLTSADGTTQTTMAVDPSTMAAGEVYAVQVTPVGEDGTAGEYAYVLLSRVKAEPTEEPTPEPTATPEPVQVGAASISVSGHSEEADGVYYAADSDITVRWNAENAVSYDVTVAGTEYSEVAITEYTLKLSDIPEDGEIIMTVTGVGADGSRGATATVAIARKTEAKWPIKPDSKPDYIKEMQVRLYTLGWISAENAALVEQGTLDEITLQAVTDFQFYILSTMPEYETELVPLDKANPVIDELTLELMFDANLNLVKPAE